MKGVCMCFLGRFDIMLPDLLVLPLLLLLLGAPRLGAWVYLDAIPSGKLVFLFPVYIFYLGRLPRDLSRRSRIARPLPEAVTCPLLSLSSRRLVSSSPSPPSRQLVSPSPRSPAASPTHRPPTIRGYGCIAAAELATTP